jgi:MoaA/NifB/PqqE/SkfB family radical SAM enzyme
LRSHSDSGVESAPSLAAAALHGLLYSPRTIPERPLRSSGAATRLAKLYVEPTVRCNLACVTCIRNDWCEPGHDMSEATFSGILDGLREFSPRPSVFFGGFGEPLSHPRIVDMVAEAHALGCAVEVITNGTLLTEQMSRALIAAGLDRLWVSLDGARPESYADVRLGATLPAVLDNLRFFSRIRPYKRPRRPELAIAFVAMRRNIADLPAVLEIGTSLSAARYLVTNVLPYTPDMRDEILYADALNNITYQPSPWMPHIDLPKMDFDAATLPVLRHTLEGHHSISYASLSLGAGNDRCPFVEAGALVVGANGGVSPCLPLLHDHTSYLNGRERRTRPYLIGNLSETGLASLWAEREHQAFRARVQDFDFAPCTPCGGCDCSLGNEEDCYGNPFPTCGGCLWAQGIIRCP